jgi:GDP-L-fucose synthase
MADAQPMTALLRPEDKIYVAGHRGMAGSSIVRLLQKRGYSNIITVSRQDVDLVDADAVSQWFIANRPDVVVLAAAKVGGIQANNAYPAEFLLNNLKIQNNVIESAWRSGSRRLLFLGSSCIYPKFAEQPIREESLLTGSLEPTNEWYAIAKITGIQLCRALRLQYGFDAISLMPTNLYGPGDNYHATNSHVLPALIRRFQEAHVLGAPKVECWGSGTPRREFLHVDDLADAVLFCLEHWQPDPHEIQFMNVGTGKDVSIKELAESVSSAVGFTGVITWDSGKPDGTPRKLLDVSRLASLGWKASIPLDIGLKQTVMDYVASLNRGEELRL